jgi:hypothetical protein
MLNIGAMSTKERLIQVLQDTPDSLLEQVLEFVQYLQWKDQPEAREPALLSQSSLAQDWLSDLEDRAWQDL